MKSTKTTSPSTRTSTPIAIVGVGGVFPGAPNVEHFWKNIVGKVDTTDEVEASRWIMPPDVAFAPDITPDHTYSKRACLIDSCKFDPTGLPLDAELFDELDPLYHVTMQAGREAIESAKMADVERSRVGVILAAIALPTDGSSALTRETLGRIFVDPVLGREPSHDKLSPYRALNRQVTSLPAALLAHAYGLGAGSYTLDAACASSLYAIKLACDELQAGRADAMLAGGVSRPENLYNQVGFSQLHALSASGKCAPFDANADGLVVGEGAGIVVLKRLDDALAADDEIWGVLHGIGLSNDVGGSLLAPDCEGQIRAMELAYQRSGWSPTDIDLIECHGTGTPMGDKKELQSLRTLWEDASWKPGQCAIGSVKSMIGHLLTAAGAAGLIKVLLALKHQTLPPSLHFTSEHPKSGLGESPFRVQTEPTPWAAPSARSGEEQTPRRAAVSAFGFGGINAHLLVEEWLETPEQRAGAQVEEQSGQTPEPIAIVGMSARVGKAASLEALREAVFTEGTLVQERPSSRWHLPGNGVGRELLEAHNLPDDLPGAYIDALEIPIGTFRMPPKEIKEILPQQLLMLQVAAAALEDAGMPMRERRTEMGALIGIGFDMETTNFHLRWALHQQVAEYAQTQGLPVEDERIQKLKEALLDALGPALNTTRTVGALGGIVASRIAKEFLLGGSSFVISAEEASGLRALEVGVRSLQQGELDAALVGAIDMAGDLRQILAIHENRPFSQAGSNRALDADADGMAVGEGAVALVLKRLSDAERDGDRIYSVIRGLGSSSGGSLLPREAEHPQKLAKQAVQMALQESKISPETVDYVETSGYGLLQRDAAEVLMLGETFATDESACGLGTLTPTTGYLGAAMGLASLAKAALSLHHKQLPVTKQFTHPAFLEKVGETQLHFPKDTQFWLRDREDGPRRAGVHCETGDGNWMHLVLEEAQAPEDSQGELFPVAIDEHALFVVDSDSVVGLQEQLQVLQDFVQHFEHSQDESVAMQLQLLSYEWFTAFPPNASHKYGFSILSHSVEGLPEQLTFALDWLKQHPDTRLDGQKGIFFTPEPLGAEGSLAFVYPGSGSHYAGMGRGIGVRWPEIWQAMDKETQRLRTQWVPDCYMPWAQDWRAGWQERSAQHIASHAHHMIFGQVVHGGMMTRLLKHFKIQPDAVIGYSLGESAALFAMDAWPERGEMLERMLASQLFQTQLAGPCTAAKDLWELPEGEPIDWATALINRSATLVQEKVENFGTARLLIVNTPDECVIGGRKQDVRALVQALGCDAIMLEGIVTVHCEAVESVKEDYYNLHLFPVSPPEGIVFYSAYHGKSYPLTSESAADSVLQQALHGFDYNKVIQQAYKDGVRLFVELGPQASCTRMIDKILSGQPHTARSACIKSEEDVFTVYRLLGTLVSERVELDLSALYPLRHPAFQRHLARKNQEESKRRYRAAIQVPVGRDPELPMPPQPLHRPQRSESTAFAPESINVPVAPAMSARAFVQTNASMPSYGDNGAFSTVTEQPIQLSGPVLFQQAPLSDAPPAQPTTFEQPLYQAPLYQVPELDAFETQASRPYEPETSYDSTFAPAAFQEELQPNSEMLMSHHKPKNPTMDLVSSMIGPYTNTMVATSQAHDAYLRFSQNTMDGFAQTYAFQNQMLEWMLASELGGQLPSEPTAQHIPQPPQTEASWPATPQMGVQGFANIPQSVPQSWQAEAPQAPAHVEPVVSIQTHMPAPQSKFPQKPSLREPGLEMAFDRDMCMEFAIGSLEKVLGKEFAPVDSYPVRVRLPDEPLMLVDRILSVEGEKNSMTSGKLVTEHDVLPDAWYLDGGRVPVCISVEAGQADLFLCSYLGIDLVVKGKRAYRLLDAEIHFHRGLPQAGEIIQYDITIDKFVSQGDVYLFFFRFDGTIDGKPLLTMRNGCAGFFTTEEIQNSGGIVQTEEELRPAEGKLNGWTPLVPMVNETYDEDAVYALRRGDLAGCFGPMFANLPLQNPVRLPTGKMELFDRVVKLEPQGGRFGLGIIQAEADIHPDDWFLTCHFVDDMVMPGTLMYECCAHTLRVLLTRMGWVGEHDAICYEPVPMTPSALRCRGPVTAETKKVLYQVEIKEIGYNPAPYVIADALMFGDGEAIVSFKDMSMQVTGLTKDYVEQLWAGVHAAQGRQVLPTSQSMVPAKKEVLFDYESILAYAIGNPSEAFGEPYRVFDEERIIARLPGPPYLFLDRITEIEPEQWELKPGGWIEGEYDVPEDAWYFRANRYPVMPFGVLLEIALQPCGWLACYLGSALHGKEDLSFRNLGGSAVQHVLVTPDIGTLRIRVRMKDVSKAGGMIIEKFDMEVLSGDTMVYEGDTYFGFFTKAALADQLGIVGAEKREYQPTPKELADAKELRLPTLAPLTPDDPEMAPGPLAVLPGRALRMLDIIEVYAPEGGTHGLGFLRGVKEVDPDEWFFKAHFYQDPVCPGSLGLESFLQLLKYAALERWGEQYAEDYYFEPISLGLKHSWVYRGQILPRPGRVEVNAVITEIKESPTPEIKANGFLKVNGLFIYEMIDFGIRLVPKASLQR